MNKIDIFINSSSLNSVFLKENKFQDEKVDKTRVIHILKYQKKYVKILIT